MLRSTGPTEAEIVPALHRRGVSQRKIAAVLDMSLGTVQRLLKQAAATPTAPSTPPPPPQVSDPASELEALQAATDRQRRQVRVTLD